jgi:NAD(P)-dependent dehydrogenase (short-subunit alcohol dehydrogenase family)
MTIAMTERGFSADGPRKVFGADFTLPVAFAEAGVAEADEIADKMALEAKAHGIPREQVIRDVLLAQQPNKRFATNEELESFAVFLAIDAAASITRAALPVDGGWTAH